MLMNIYKRGSVLVAVVAIFTYDHLVDHRHELYILLSKNLIEFFIAFILIRRILHLLLHPTSKYLYAFIKASSPTFSSKYALSA